MWNVYIIVKGESENPNVYASNLTAESIERIKKLNLHIAGDFTRYSNWIWVDSSYSAKLTGHILKETMIRKGKTVDYFVDELLDTEDGLQDFIENELKKLACKNNIIIVSEEICKKLVKLLNKGNDAETREYYHFKQDITSRNFTLCDK